MKKDVMATLMRAFVLVVIASAGLTVVRGQGSSPAGEWLSYGGTNWSQKYSALDQIDRNNFGALKVEWTKFPFSGRITAGRIG